MRDPVAAARGPDQGKPPRRRHEVEVPVPASDVEGAVDETEVLQGGPDALDAVTREDGPSEEAQTRRAPHPPAE